MQLEQARTQDFQLPLEMWHIIILSLKGTKSRFDQYIDPEPYWVIVRTASVFSKHLFGTQNMKMILLRTLNAPNISLSILPNQWVHCEGAPALKRAKLTVWYNNGVVHREEGPAIIEQDVQEEWRQHGRLYRIGGPTIVRVNDAAGNSQHQDDAV